MKRTALLYRISSTKFVPIPAVVLLVQLLRDISTKPKPTTVNSSHFRT